MSQTQDIVLQEKWDIRVCNGDNGIQIMSVRTDQVPLLCRPDPTDTSILLKPEDWPVVMMTSKDFLKFVQKDGSRNWRKSALAHMKTYLKEEAFCCDIDISAEEYRYNIDSSNNFTLKQDVIDKIERRNKETLQKLQQRNSLTTKVFATIGTRFGGLNKKCIWRLINENGGTFVEGTPTRTVTHIIVGEDATEKAKKK